MKLFNRKNKINSEIPDGHSCVIWGDETVITKEEDVYIKETKTCIIKFCPYFDRKQHMFLKHRKCLKLEKDENIKDCYITNFQKICGINYNFDKIEFLDNDNFKNS